MKLHSYESLGGKNLILDYILKLSKDEQVDGFSVLEKLEEGRFDELTIKPWRGKISEVYFYKHNRIFYVIPDGEDIYLLHACRKQKNKTEKQDSEKVIKRAQEIGEILSKKFI
ncbi:MAG: type II toxin-antitoxin system RelE/ParE family toxin [Eubacterium sp.]|jgi:phage-related protein|nr:type II toxin-antitoxin system RelE/ParE family toxin [Eubacterium sp.]